MSDYETRFGGIGRLYGAAALKHLQRAHVCVVGIGGVGSWAAEALARSGVGALTLVDLDDVCVSNVNRQLHALDGEIGKLKVEVIARRAQAINPACNIKPVPVFFTATTAEELLATRFDCVVDAIDGVTNKSLLIATCKAKGIPIVTTGGAGGRRDPTAIRAADLVESKNDRLLQQVRRRLRREHGFSRDLKKKFGVTCVFSEELPVFPHKDGTVCARKEKDGELQLDCNSGYGTATFVTGAFGFAAASVAVERIVGG